MYTLCANFSLYETFRCELTMRIISIDQWRCYNCIPCNKLSPPTCINLVVCFREPEQAHLSVSLALNACRIHVCSIEELNIFSQKILSILQTFLPTLHISHGTRILPGKWCCRRGIWILSILWFGSWFYNRSMTQNMWMHKIDSFLRSLASFACLPNISLWQTNFRHRTFLRPQKYKLHL